MFLPPLLPELLVYITDFELPPRVLGPTFFNYCQLDLFLESTVPPAIDEMSFDYAACTAIISPYGMFFESTKIILLFELFVIGCLSCYMLCAPTRLCIDVMLLL